MEQPARRRAIRALCLYNAALAAAGGAVLLYLYLLRVRGVPFICFFSRVTHLYCPGCGCTRAVEALLRFDFGGALAAHAFVPLACVLLLYYEIAFVRAACGKIPLRAVPSGPTVAAALFLPLYALARDLLLVFFRIDFLGDLFTYWS